MRLVLRYHDGDFPVDLPGRDAVRVVGSAFPPPLRDEEHAFRLAVEKPVRCAPLAKLIPPAGRISVLISDLTRGAGTRKTLGWLLRFLEENGAGPRRVEIVLALGTHRAQSSVEIEAHLGTETAGRWRVCEHDARDAASLVETGTTPAGTRCLFNKRVAESELVIALGTVSFHYFAGYGGGRKLVLPGVAGEKTILANHRLSLKRDPGEGLASGCRPGNLDGNPVHEDMLAGARLLGVRLVAINSVPDEAGNVLFINAGELDASHRAACDYVSANFRVPLDHRFHAVIASAGGYPKDINLLQSHKALRQASFALDEGGLLLAAAACSEGVGSDSYFGAFEGGRHAVPDAVRRGYTLNSQTAISTYELTARLSIYLRSTLADVLLKRFGLCPWKDEYTGYLLDGIPDRDILVIANAAQFLPVPA